MVAALRWRTPSPAVVQAVSCATAILAVVPSTWAVVDAFTTAGTSGGAALLAHQSETLVLLVGFLVSPAPVLAGAGAVSFGRTVTDFLARSVDVLTGRRHLAFLAVFLLLLLWRAAATTVEIVGADNGGALAVKALLLAVVLPGAAAWWAWATRGFDETGDEVEEGSAQGTGWVTVLVLFVFLLTGLVSVVAFLETAYFGSLHMVAVFNDVNELANREGVITATMLGAGALLAAWAAWSARREPSVLAAWLGVAGGVIVLVVGWNNVLTDRAWVGLGVIDYAHAALLVVAVAAGWQLVRWRADGVAPSPGWTLTAFSAVALTALVAQGTFLEDPFRPLLGFTGLGLVFFGLIWGLLTAGAHASATGLAGMGRTAVMLSYAVLTTLLIAWGDATAGAVDQALNGGFATAGKNIIGGALLVALLAVWIPILFGLAEPAPVIALRITGGASVSSGTACGPKKDVKPPSVLSASSSAAGPAIGSSKKARRAKCSSSAACSSSARSPTPTEAGPRPLGRRRRRDDLHGLPRDPLEAREEGLLLAGEVVVEGLVGDPGGSRIAGMLSPS